MDTVLFEKEIEKTEYWDVPVLDVQINYFGDEVDIYIANTEESCWRISFLSCYRLKYETDANWRGESRVKKMRYSQLGYYGQDFDIKLCTEMESFIEVKIDLTIMLMEIICKEITVEEVKLSEISFFWEKNKRHDSK